MHPARIIMSTLILFKALFIHTSSTIFFSPARENIRQPNDGGAGLGREDETVDGPGNAQALSQSTVKRNCCTKIANVCAIRDQRSRTTIQDTVAEKARKSSEYVRCQLSNFGRSWPTLAEKNGQYLPVLADKAFTFPLYPQPRHPSKCPERTLLPSMPEQRETTYDSDLRSPLRRPAALELRPRSSPKMMS